MIELDFPTTNVEDEVGLEYEEIWPLRKENTESYNVNLRKGKDFGRNTIVEVVDKGVHDGLLQLALNIVFHKGAQTHKILRDRIGIIKIC